MSVNKKSKKYMSAFLCAILLTCFPYSIYTAPNTAKYDAAIKDAQKNIAETEAKQKEILESKKVIDAKIAEVSIVIHGLNEQVDSLNSEIAIKQNEIDMLEKKEQENKVLFTKRMRALYEDNANSGIELLLSSKSLGDLFYRIDIISQVAEYDQKVIAEIINQKDIEEAAKSELAVKVSELDVVIAKRAGEQDVLEGEAAKSQAIYDELKADKAAYEAIEAAAEAKRDAEIKAAEAKNNTSNTPLTITGGKLNMPTKGGVNTSSYGMRIHPVTGKSKMHTGLDIGAATGTNIVAAEAGTVIVSTYESGYGNYIVISHGGGMTTLYAHCSARLASVGQKVTRGQLIGKVGSTGLSTGPHLHFEVRINGAFQNPLPYIS